jgi:hypothetical protein
VKRFVATIAAVSLLCLALVPAVQAESSAGFRLGAIRSVFVGDESDQLPWSRVGFTGGASIGFDSGKHVGFRTDLLYTQKGGGGPGMPIQVGYIDPASVSWTYIHVDYLELVPLLVGRFPLSGRFSIRAFVGPSIGLWINAEEQMTSVDPATDTEYVYDLDIGDCVEHWDFSATAGAELNMQAGPYVLLLEARYAQGSRVFESVGLENRPLDLNLSNSGVRVMAGVMVPF